MAQTDSQSPEFEGDGPSESKPDFIDSGSGELVESDASDSSQDGFDKDVEELLDSVDPKLDESESTDSDASLPQDGDQLLKQAGSILNGGDVDLIGIDLEAEKEPESNEPESLMDMPDPLQMMAESEAEVDSEETVESSQKPDPDEEISSDEETSADADSSDSEDDEIMAMPDPQALMEEASMEQSPGANIADRAGDLPPPPPAPVALDEDEIELEAPPVAAVPKEEVAEEPEESESPPEEESIDVPEEAPSAESESDLESEETVEPEASESEPAESESDDDLDLDDDDALLLDDDADEDLFAADSEGEAESKGKDEAQSDSVIGATESDSPTPADSRPSKARALIASAQSSMPLAAGLCLVGIGLIIASFKNELIEIFQHGDIQGSSLNQRVASITQDIFEELGGDSDFSMTWLESDIQRVSDTEIRIIANIGAELKRDLYEEVSESIAFARLPFNLEMLETAEESVSKNKKDGEASIALPRPGWSVLIAKSAAKGEVFPIDVSYRLLRDSKGSKWALSNLRMKEGEGRFAWSQGKPKSHFGSKAVDVRSREFPGYIRAYEKQGLAFLDKARKLEEARIAALNEESRLAEEKRRDLVMAFSQGSYFKGMVIAGTDGDDAREISLIITETRNEGDLVKGFLKLEEQDAPAKHFTGILDVVDGDDGPKATLSLTTIAFAGQNVTHSAPKFFNPGTVSRIQLLTDGYRVEGDAADLSLRLIRSL